MSCCSKRVVSAAAMSSILLAFSVCRAPHSPRQWAQRPEQKHHHKEPRGAIGQSLRALARLLQSCKEGSP